jgi:hypothetical protein
MKKGPGRGGLDRALDRGGTRAFGGVAFHGHASPKKGLVYCRPFDSLSLVRVPPASRGKVEGGPAIGGSRTAFWLQARLRDEPLRCPFHAKLLKTI